MKPGTALPITSLVSIFFLSLHFTSDFIHNAGELSLKGVLICSLILIFLLAGTLFLAERVWGHIIMLLGGLGALGMPVLHLWTPRAVAGAINRPGAFIFVWALLALAVTGLLTVFLSVYGLWSLRRGRARPPATG